MGHKDDFAELIRNLQTTQATEETRPPRRAIVGALAGLLISVAIASWLLMLSVGIVKHVFDPSWLRTISFLETLVLYVAWLYAISRRREN